MRIIRTCDLPLIPASHENPLSPGVWKRVLLKKADLQTGTVQMVNWASLPAGNTFAPHYHEDMQEIFVMIQGVARITVDAETTILGRGDAILIDPHEVHQMWNHGSEDAEYLAIGISAGRGGRTVAVGEG